MRFLKISFTNYRCFRSGEIDFSLPKKASGGRNIILFSWENGGGKTNLMFAFRFALYGMTETEYKAIPGQEKTPWALNQNVYIELERNGKVGESRFATVKLAFEYRNKTYTVERTHVFTRDPKKVSSPIEKVALIVQDNNTGDTEAVYEDPRDVSRQVERIIPEKTLYALLCDGERVRRLSSTGSQTNLAVQAVIARMTEHELLNLVQDGLGKVRRQVQRKISSGATRDEDKLVAVKVANLQKNIDDDECACKAADRRIKENKHKLDLTSLELEQIAAVKQLERDRVAEEKKRKEYEKDLENAQKKLIGTLNKQAYWAMSGKLCNAVNDLMKDASVRFPGLEADIVDVVMKGEKCICGRSIDEHIREYMAILRKQLPPFNVDAILSGVLHEYGTEDRRADYRGQVAERSETITILHGKINQCSQNIAELSNRIKASHNPNALAIEQERDNLNSQIMKDERENAVRRNDILRSKAELAELNKRLKEITKKTGGGALLAKKLDLLKSAEKGIETIKRLREAEALGVINKYLAKAFAMLRSNSDKQRQAYISRFEEEHRLFVYHEAKVASAIKELGGACDDKKKEELILKESTSSSMGQLKMSSLAFMKAILDYVHETAKKDENLSDAEYPVIMDAPFSDIKGENYVNAVSNIHLFAKQVILLLADKEAPKGILPYVAKRYTVDKVAVNEGAFNDSIIKLVK